MRKERIKYLNELHLNRDGKYVLYWLQNACRINYNHSLSLAIDKANDLDLPLLVVFGINQENVMRTVRHYSFFVDGLDELANDFVDLGIEFKVVFETPETACLVHATDAALIITDKAYLRHEKQSTKAVIEAIKIPLIAVETNLVVPLDSVLEKEAYNAKVIRSRIMPLVDYFANDWELNELKYKTIYKKNAFDFKTLVKNKSVLQHADFSGGATKANRVLEEFVLNKLAHYDELRNHPELDYQSGLSPYLHYGQISPIEIYLTVKNIPQADKFIEELIVRRELAFNFVYYNDHYDSLMALPEWLIKNLRKHASDKREYQYDLKVLESFQTHDVYWNSCQKEMVITGKMHGYMRMYWGKKIIEWTKDYETAYEYMIYLNNKYNLDGNDPNAYAGVAWCFGKHDRPWREREVFGMIRYMNNRGLESKFDIDLYVQKISDFSLPNDFK